MKKNMNRKGKLIMKNRRNHSSHEEEYFFRISLKTIADVNEFCNSFDYRNAGKLHNEDMEHVRNSIERAIEFLTSRKPSEK